jgi:hypothetical protein
MIIILSRIGVIYKTGFLDWMIGFVVLSTFTQLETTGNTALSLFYTLSGPPLHSHYDSVFPSRILATDFTTVSLSLQISSEIFLSQSNAFLAISAADNSDDSTRLLSTTVVYSTVLRFYFCSCRTLLTTILHGPRGKNVFCCQKCVFTGQLRSNECPSIVERLCCWNVFTDPLPSNGYIRHNIKYATLRTAWADNF